ncbi:MAG: hypothetical protein HYU66_20230, partial [Armatimonadetes bacterium]|nr:hypothetical protein [Armatimonadota bacterium]
MRRLACLCALLAATRVFAAATVIDSFDYPTDQAARAAWPAQMGSPDCASMPHGDGFALRIPADFTGDLARATCDKKVE